MTNRISSLLKHIKKRQAPQESPLGAVAQLFAPPGTIVMLGTGLPKPRKYQSYPRRVPKGFAKEVRRYSTEVGEILWAWNRIHGLLAQCFWILLEKHDVGLALWHALKSDAAQREALVAVLLQTKEVDPDIAEALEWLVNVMQALSTYRNDATHGPMLQETSASGTVRLVPDHIANLAPRLNRLSRADRDSFHRRLKGDLVSLSFFAAHIVSELYPLGDKPKSIQKRPILQSISRNDIQLTRSKKRHRKAAHKRGSARNP